MLPTPERSSGRAHAIRVGGVTRIAWLVAAAYGVLLIIAGFFVPVYRSSSESAAGEVAPGWVTLVEVNGPGGVVAISVPLLATVLVGSALRLRSRRGALPFAWSVTGLLAAFNLLAMASIGLFILPVTAALTVACATSPR
jgi:hypothetical protein